MLALDLLRVLFADGVLLGGDMPLIGSPSIGGETGDANGFQESLLAEQDVVLPPSEHLRQDLPGVVVDSMPERALLRFLTDIGPHFVAL